MINETVNIQGLVTIQLFDSEGNLREEQKANMVLNGGLAYIASRMVNTSQAAMSHMAIGIGTSAVTKVQTALSVESTRVALDSTTLVTTTVANDSVQYIATFGPGVGTGAITEALLVNAATGGTGLARVLFDVVNKGALDTLAITWKTIIS